jgi:predicted DNA-binding protein
MNEFKLPNLNEEKSVLKTIRLKLATLKKLEKLSKKNDISVNRLINECIEFALNNLTDKDLKAKDE